MTTERFRDLAPKSDDVLQEPEERRRAMPGPGEPYGEGWSPEEPWRHCPDNGRCHHGCGERECWRVHGAGPLSAAHFPGDHWPEAIRQRYANPNPDPLADATVMSVPEGYVVTVNGDDVSVPHRIRRAHDRIGVKLLPGHNAWGMVAVMVQDDDDRTPTAIHLAGPPPADVPRETCPATLEVREWRWPRVVPCEAPEGHGTAHEYQRGTRIIRWTDDGAYHWANGFAKVPQVATTGEDVAVDGPEVTWTDTSGAQPMLNDIAADQPFPDAREAFRHFAADDDFGTMDPRPGPSPDMIARAKANPRPASGETFPWIEDPAELVDHLRCRSTLHDLRCTSYRGHWNEGEPEHHNGAHTWDLDGHPVSMQAKRHDARTRIKATAERYLARAVEAHTATAAQARELVAQVDALPDGAIERSMRNADPVRNGSSAPWSPPEQIRTSGIMFGITEWAASPNGQDASGADDPAFVGELADYLEAQAADQERRARADTAERLAEQAKTDPPHTSREAKVIITKGSIHHLLGLPPSYRIVTLGQTFDPPAIVVVVESPDLEPVDDAVEMPIVPGAWDRASIWYDGKLYSRWGWEPDEPPSL